MINKLKNIFVNSIMVGTIEEAVKEVEEYFNFYWEHSEDTMFYLTFRRKTNKDNNNSFGIVFFDSWPKIVEFIQKRKLTSSHIAYFGEVSDNTDITFCSNGELFTEKALD